LPVKRGQKPVLFSLLPELAPWAFNMLMLCVVAVSILIAALPGMLWKWQLEPLAQTIVFSLVAFALWSGGYALGNREGDGKAAFRKAFYMRFLPGMCFWYAAILSLVLAEDPAAITIYGLVASGAIALAALLTWFRAASTFSIDCLFAVGSFFPSSCKLETRSVFGFIRHPFLSVALLLSLALLALAPNLLPIACYAIVYGTAWLWSRKEEIELGGRFGEQYDAYRNGTGRFFPRLATLPHFFICLARG